MTCARLHAFVDGELDASNAESFRAHLASCGDCQSELPRVAALVALVEAASDKWRVPSSGRALTKRPRPAVYLGGSRLYRSVIGQYRVTGVLGEGGMGVVYAAEHTLLGRLAAVKLLRPELSRDAQMVQQFYNEVRAATAARHPGIVEIYDFGRTDDGAAFIVMELLQGETLRARIDRGPMGWSTSLGIVRQIAGALGAAHAKGIIHRDLKPDNIFLVPDPEVPRGERIKLLDFGVAKLTGSSPGHNMTRTGTVIGTPTYMAPEQCRGVAIDARVDLYSLGCILFELCTGRPPFAYEATGDIFVAHIQEPPPAISSLTNNVPQELEALVQRLLAKSPADRVQTVNELIRLIDAAWAAISQIARSGSHPVLAPAGSLSDIPASTAHDGPGGGEVAPTLLERSSPRRARRDAVVTTLAVDEEQASAAGALVTQPAPAPSILDTTLSSAIGAQETTTRGPARRLMLGGLGGLRCLVVLGAVALLFALSLGGGDEAPVQAVPASEAEAPASFAGTPSPPSAAETSATVAVAPSPFQATSPAPPTQSDASDSATPSRPARKNNAKAPASPPRWRATQVKISIESVPSGAGVYRGTFLFGNTPLVMELDRGEYGYDIELRLAGYHSHKLLVHSTKDEHIHVELKRSPPSPPSAQRPKPGLAPSAASSR